MPALGESVTEGTVTRWLKAVGDTVVADEPLLEVSTDKVDTEIPAPASGVLLAITVGEDSTVEVGAELGVIGAAVRGALAAARTDPCSDCRTAPPPLPPRLPPHRRAAPWPPQRHCRRRHPHPRRPPATPTPTSPRWCGAWPRSTASTCPPSPAPASAGGSASPTCSTPR